MVHLFPLDERPSPERLKKLERVTAAAFGQRRKMLRASLRPVFADPESTLASLAIDPEARAEDLTVAQFAAIAVAAGGEK